MKKKVFKSLILSFSIIILIIIGYAVYILTSYYRIEDNLKLQIENLAEFDIVDVNNQYTISTYNIGFGAHSQDYTFFMDKGETLEGKKTQGRWSKAKSLDEVIFNTRGAIKTITDLSPDFCLFQEVDTQSTRSFKVDQYQMMKIGMPEYNSTFGNNFHTTYLPYPIHDMHGKSNSGIATFSKYSIISSTRYSLTVTDSLSKLFDLDRCFVVNEFNTSDGNKLIIINVHMSAYDKGGVVKEKQLQELNSYLKTVKELGYYVILGGDFNHDILSFNPLYDYDLENNNPFSKYISHKKPDWLRMFFNEEKTCDIESGYSIISSFNAPTVRDISVEWEIGRGYVTITDGFIVSDNVEVISSETIVTKNGKKNIEHFAYSDHDPVLLKFKFK